MVRSTPDQVCDAGGERQGHTQAWTRGRFGHATSPGFHLNHNARKHASSVGPDRGRGAGVDRPFAAAAVLVPPRWEPGAPQSPPWRPTTVQHVQPDTPVAASAGQPTGLPRAAVADSGHRFAVWGTKPEQRGAGTRADSHTTPHNARSRRWTCSSWRRRQDSVPTAPSSFCRTRGSTKHTRRSSSSRAGRAESKTHDARAAWNPSIWRVGATITDHARGDLEDVPGGLQAQPLLAHLALRWFHWSMSTIVHAHRCQHSTLPVSSPWGRVVGSRAKSNVREEHPTSSEGRLAEARPRRECSGERRNCRSVRPGSRSGVVVG